MTLLNREILVIDDELQIRKLLQITLQSHSFSVILTNTSEEGLSAAANKYPDLILLDLGLPDENGHETLRKLREWSKVPVIILTVQSREEDIIRALDNGANDYLVKPFRTGELLARIRSALRRSEGEDNNPVIKFSGIELDITNHTVKVNNEPIQLTQTQYALLVLFLKNEGKVLTHQFILREIWGEEFINQLQYLRVFVAQLRKRLEQNNSGVVYISTVSGVGYRFVCKPLEE
jgi:two-component system, OmpR family, KDP operon response regulator KdpE